MAEPMMDMMGGDESSEMPPLGGEMGGAEEPFEPADEFEREAVDAFDDSLPMASRMLALKEAIRLCVEQDKAGGYKAPGGAGPKTGLALVFGDKEKKD